MDTDDFQSHIQYHHNIWDYMYYIGYLRTTAQYRLDDVDEYIISCMGNKDSKWMPFAQIEDEDGEFGDNSFGNKGMIQQYKVLRGLMIGIDSRVSKLTKAHDKMQIQDQIEFLNQERGKMTEELQNALEGSKAYQNDKEKQQMRKMIKAKKSQMKGLYEKIHEIDEKEKERLRQREQEDSHPPEKNTFDIDSINEEMTKKFKGYEVRFTNIDKNVEKVKSMIDKIHILLNSKVGHF